MRVLISAGMAGVTGVTCPDDVRPGSARWDLDPRAVAIICSHKIFGMIEGSVELDYG